MAIPNDLGIPLFWYSFGFKNNNRDYLCFHARDETNSILIDKKIRKYQFQLLV